MSKVMDRSMEAGWSQLLGELTEEEKNVVKPNEQTSSKMIHGFGL